jgi:hypothetical protein
MTARMPDAGRPRVGAPAIRLAIAVAVLSVIAMAAELRAADAAGHPGERSFVVDVNPLTIGQAPDWLDRRHVVWQDPSGQDVDDDGEIQIYRSALDGTERVCLTCGLDGPNQVYDYQGPCGGTAPADQPALMPQMLIARFEP